MPTLFVPLFILLIPIVVILTRHQQKMTELMRPDGGTHLQLRDPDLQAIQYDVQQLKSMVATLAMSVDSLKDEVRNTNSIQDRVKVGEH